MPVSVDDIAELEKVLSAPDAAAPTVADLRRRFPHLAWTRCDAADVTEAPFRAYAQFDIHLLDGADHCPHITADPTRATGIVLARRTSAP
jgi:hypothetical protein